ncbi:hypothetical protein BS50DRAFT_580154 [Corynespora cassiicola Philippines]|uniref:Uncharacterized protein n=1 Tax=Corynespora cassiicola Philippines TaxID=1448308 RepID=A0A2T2N296_CORCC|nr:hypothetical protein BS50DRAFT_580154 [Corynespora cassiicola Philippines]
MLSIKDYDKSAWLEQALCADVKEALLCWAYYRYVDRYHNAILSMDSGFDVLGIDCYSRVDFAREVWTHWMALVVNGYLSFVVEMLVLKS